MRISEINLKNFRNYQSAKVELDPLINIFVGKNGAGKTSILEAIYVLCFSKSYKAHDQRLINFNSEFAKISCIANLDTERIELSLVIAKNGKKAIKNGFEVKRLSEFIGNYNVVLFAPEDLELIKGSPIERRNFIDSEMGQVSKKYLYNLSMYKKHLKYRNDLLKQMNEENKFDKDLLDIATTNLMAFGKSVKEGRLKFIEIMNTFLLNRYEKISGKSEKIELEYVTDEKNESLEAYQNSYQYDLKTKSTNIGVHRDDILIKKNGLLAKDYTSQGEARTICLVIKLALVDFIRAYKKENPILLLDDVFSELDLTRQNELLKSINKETQTIITTTSIKEIDQTNFKRVKVFEVCNQEVKEYEYKSIQCQ